ncbi:MAG TPA: hypothetical protein VFY23_02595 [Candidatus Limnocylindrales bacterium]|nr:hypothetical protein [Candidatus Limnocylindrales bacterium]
MSDTQFERAITDWLEDRVDRTPERAIDGVLLAIKTTPQERDLRVPWRFSKMPMNRTVGLAAGLAAAALVVAVGGGGMVYLANRDSSGMAGRTGAPSTAAPTAAAPSESAAAPPSASAPPVPSIDVPAGWTQYEGTVAGYPAIHPQGWEAMPARGDTDSAEFVSADNELGVGVTARPAGDGADLATVAGLAAWAQAYCTTAGVGGCDTLPDRVEAMCLATPGDACRPAIIARSEGRTPDDEGEYAFFGDWLHTAEGAAPERVVVVATGRGDTYPGAAPFGGAVQLLRTMLAAMGVTADGASAPEVAPGIAAWTPYTSQVYGYTLGHPAGWEVAPAVREWEPGSQSDRTADVFVRSDNEIGVAVRRIPASGSDAETIDALEAVATRYCADAGLPDCDTFVDRVEPMCLKAADDPCRAAILVRSDGANPDDDGEHAFFGDWNGAPEGAPPTGIIVVSTGRGDAFEGAAQYGGAVRLLASILSTMSVTAPE